MIISNGLLIHCWCHYKLIPSICKAFWLYVVGQGAPTFWLSSPTSGNLANKILQNMRKVLCRKLYITAVLKTWWQLEDARIGAIPNSLSLDHDVASCFSSLYTSFWSLPKHSPCPVSVSWVLLLIINTFNQHFPGSLFHILSTSYLLPVWHLETTCNYLFTCLSPPLYCALLQGCGLSPFNLRITSTLPVFQVLDKYLY